MFEIYLVAQGHSTIVVDGVEVTLQQGGVRTRVKMANSTPCLICRRMADIRAGNNPYFVAEVETGYVVLGDYQFFRGYTLLLCKQHVSELHDLPAPVRRQYLQRGNQTPCSDHP
jgi:hypothetical protein